MKIGIKIKLAAVLSGLMFMATFSIGILMIAHQRNSLNAQMRSMAGTVTSEFASNAKIPLMQKDTLEMNMLVQSILKNPDIHAAFILNDNLMIEGRKDINRAGQEFFIDKKMISRAEGPPPWKVSEGSGAITFVSPITFQGTTVGYAVVLFSDSFIKQRLHLAMTSVAAVMGVSILVVSLISIPLASGLLRPIFRLFKGTKEIALGNFDYRIQEKSKSEIGDLVSSFNNMAEELKKKEILKGAFNRYVSQHVADEILREPERIRLGGDRRNVTVFFADIRGFTSLSRHMTPEEIVEILNRYFTLITEIVFRFEGTVDKFIGDAVMSVFGSPISSDTHLESGIKAAVAIKKSVDEVNRLRQKRGLIPLQVGMGLDSGEVIVGNMGSHSRMEYTAVGDAVNLASRFTDIAKSGEIIISEEVYKAIGDIIVAEKIDGIMIKGFDRPVTLYNIIDLKVPYDVDSAVEKILFELRDEGFVL